MSITDHADYLLSFFASILPLQASRSGQHWSEASRSSWNQKPVLLLKYTAFFLGSLLFFLHGCFGLHVELKLLQQEEERMRTEEKKHTRS